MKVRLGLSAAIAFAALAGCAKDPTTILIGVGTDGTAPPIRVLDTAVVSDLDPAQRTGSSRTSSEISDAADRPGPFVFPVYLAMTVDASLAGPVTITVRGLDWDDSSVVLASGTGPGVVVAGHETRAVVMLAPVAAPPADGGAPDAGTD